MLRSNHLEVSYFRTKLYIIHFVTKLNLVDQYSITAMVRRFYVKNLAQIYIGKSQKNLYKNSMTFVIQFYLKISKYFQDNVPIGHPWNTGFEI